MSKEHVNAIAELFKSSMAATLAAAEKIPEEQRMTQAQEGKSHPTWLLGHMALITANGAMGMCLGKAPAVPKEYQPLFAPDFLGGQPIQSDASAYPAWDEIIETYKTVTKAVVASIRELEDSELAGPPKGSVPEALKDRFEVLGNSLTFMVLHNTYHMGQMNLLAALNVSAVTT